MAAARFYAPGPPPNTRGELPLLAKIVTLIGHFPTVHFDAQVDCRKDMSSGPGRLFPLAKQALDWADGLRLLGIHRLEFRVWGTECCESFLPAADHFQVSPVEGPEQFVHASQSEQVVQGRDDEGGNRLRICGRLSCGGTHGFAGNIKICNCGKVGNSGRGLEPLYLRRNTIFGGHYLRVFNLTFRDQKQNLVLGIEFKMTRHETAWF